MVSRVYHKPRCQNKTIKKVSLLERSVTLESMLFPLLSSQTKQSKSLVTFALTIFSMEFMSVCTSPAPISVNATIFKLVIALKRQ